MEILGYGSSALDDPSGIQIRRVKYRPTTDDYLALAGPKSAELKSDYTTRLTKYILHSTAWECIPGQPCASCWAGSDALGGRRLDPATKRIQQDQEIVAKLVILPHSRR
ncbi:unnamed protein product [Diplocarpon coronariae]|nr:hypothetical protein JHW43_006801 [Diplocarpon mali]